MPLLIIVYGGSKCSRLTIKAYYQTWFISVINSYTIGLLSPTSHWKWLNSQRNLYQKSVNNLLTDLYKITDKREIGVTAQQLGDCNNLVNSTIVICCWSSLPWALCSCMNTDICSKLANICPYFIIRRVSTRVLVVLCDCRVSGTSPDTSVVQRKWPDCFKAISGINMAYSTD